MKKETKHAIIVIVAAFAVIAVGFIGVYVSSGVNPPQTVVESWSMQHGKESQIGIIDTGDVILLKNKDKVDICSYVDGYTTGYQKFGDYGDVIIYSRGETLNPVIHRAILWLEYNGDHTWSAPSLANYPSDMWSCTGGDDHNNLSGTLTMKEMGYDGSYDPTLNLNTLADRFPHSGFITMGDNNSGFDQPSNTPGVNGLVAYEQINSVAWKEVPWVGAFKMLLNGKRSVLDDAVPNTIPSLAAAIIGIVFLLVGISFLFDQRYYKKYRKELINEMNAPAPSFPLEEEEE
ncbi:MAG: S26 family signal peptidase [Methanomassiliicoccaceae archaeon]|nr:S26 family signal peptidase [Methanomassiliicoccaceae archaeon]